MTTIPSSIVSMNDTFNEKTNLNAQFYVNAPGRVNIIGEHTDHQYYGVLPCCIDRSIKCVGAVDPEANYILRVSNTDSKYGDVTFKKYSDLKAKKGHWTNYVISALAGLLEYMSTGISTPDITKISAILDVRGGQSVETLASNPDNNPIPKGLTLMFDSNLPAAAGVSSSSSLVVCSIRAFIEASCQGPHAEEFEAILAQEEGPYSPKAIGTFSVPAERHCGTASGGMDQAIICLGGENKALNINFNPLESNVVTLPENFALIVANTGRKSAKAEMAPFMYNKRVFELRLGNLLLIEAALKRDNKLTDEAKIELREPTFLPRLRDVERRFFSQSESHLVHQEMIDLAKQALKTVYTKADIFGLFSNAKLDELLKLSGRDVLEKNTTFHLQQPICHVLSETQRVDLFVKHCSEAKIKGEDPHTTALSLGALMNDSHYSLRDQFTNSCPELEELTTVARDAGAYGARMTGAGWGGCCVIAVKAQEAENVKHALLEKYYKCKIDDQIADKENNCAITVLPVPEADAEVTAELLKDTCFVAPPSAAAFSGRFEA